jgi:hypothetical protein
MSEHGYPIQVNWQRLRQFAIQQGIDEDRFPYYVSQSCNGMNSSIGIWNKTVVFFCCSLYIDHKNTDHIL